MNPSPLLSIIIPVWRDGAMAAELASRIASWDFDIECIAAVAGDCAELDAVEKTGLAQIARVARPSRGAQLNAGAALARGATLLFHHADSELTPVHVTSLLVAMHRPEIIGGAFCRAFDDRHPHLRWLEPFVRRWSRCAGTLYGDQSIFVRRATFRDLGGFAPIPLMEDVEFSGRLRKAGPVALLDPPLRTSDRQHRRDGAWRTSFRNGLFLALYRLGVSPETLHRWYYRRERETDPFPQKSENNTAPLPL